MSGSRTKTGCYTCRIRKKKCDEARPTCVNCRTRDIHCHGYGERPVWMLGKRSWMEVLATDEARLIREAAERTYSTRRRFKTKAPQVLNHQSSAVDEIHRSGVLSQVGLSSRGLETNVHAILESGQGLSRWAPDRLAMVTHLIQKHLLQAAILTPTPISTISPHLSRSMDFELLLTFLNVIFPLQHFPYQKSSSRDQEMASQRSPQWLFKALIESEHLYSATASIAVVQKSTPFNTASFIEAGAKVPVDPTLSPMTQSLQSKALKGLQQRIDELSSEVYKGEDLLKTGMQALAIMTELVSLDVFTMTAGQWEMHLKGSRTILGLFQHKWAPELFVLSTTPFTIHPSSASQSMSSGAKQNRNTSHTSIGQGHSGQYTSDDLHALEFFITSFIWVDIISNATYSPPPSQPREFTYMPLLKMGLFQPVTVMGCQSCIMIALAEITALERWRNVQILQGGLSMMEFINRAKVINDSLECGIANLEANLKLLHQNRELSVEETDAHGGQVNLVFAYGALVYLHTIISGPNPAIPEIRRNMMRCLEGMEELPAHCVVRITWPMTMAGCMAVDEDVQKRFRAVLSRTVEKGEQLGNTWKGLKVMEECWRLRSSKKDSSGWWCRNTMDQMGLKILLI